MSRVLELYQIQPDLSEEQKIEIIKKAALLNTINKGVGIIQRVKQ